MNYQSRKLGECATIVNGFAFDSELFSAERKGIPLARIRDVVRGYSETYYVGDYPSSVMLQNGDLLIGMDGEFNVGVWKGGTALLNQRVCKIVPKDGVAELCYLKYLLPTVLQRIEDATPFVTVKHLSSEDLKDEVIALPSPSEQKRIGRILEQADRLRLIRRYALELGEPFLPAAFVNLFGDPDVNPNEFRITGLGEYLSFVTSGSRGWAEYYVPQGTRFIRSLDVRMNHIAATNAVFVNPPDGAEADRTRVKAGDVLLTITGAQVGRVAPVPKRIEGAFVSQHVSILRLKKGISPIFLSMYLSLESGGQREINRLQYGQTKPGLNLQQIREFQILAPPLAIQQEFEAIVERYERLLSVHREALRQAEHLFQTLLHRAFTTGL